MTAEEAKKKAEEIICQGVEILHNNIKDEKALNERYLELATSFLTLSLNPEKDLDDLNDDIKSACKDIYEMALGGIIRYKTGDHSKVVKRFDN